VNCQEWEERIAGDLEDAAVTEHVAECPGCQVFASGLRQTLAELRSTHAEEIAPAHYAAVRARVLAELQPRRRWGWVWAAAGVAAAVVAVMAIMPRMRVEELPPRESVAVVPPAPAAPVVRVAATPAPRKARVRTEEVVMKIETGNPDVVIYWIAEAKGAY
jgi:hypothetical protein